MTVVAPLGKLAGASLLTVTPGQLSAAVGLPSATPVAMQAPRSVPTVRARGALMVGFSWSSTVTSCVAVAVLPAASRAVQVTVVAPLAKLAGASLLTVTPGQLSDAVGLPSATPVAVQAPASVPIVRARGALIVGFS